MDNNLQLVKQFTKSSLYKYKNEENKYYYKTIYGESIDSLVISKDICQTNMCACGRCKDKIFYNTTFGYTFLCLECGRLYALDRRAGTLHEFIEIGEGEFHRLRYLYDSNSFVYDKHMFIIDSSAIQKDTEEKEEVSRFLTLVSINNCSFNKGKYTKEIEEYTKRTDLDFTILDPKCTKCGAKIPNIRYLNHKCECGNFYKYINHNGLVIVQCVPEQEKYKQ